MATSKTEGLTETQQEAVDHTEGPLLILAGPGSGKTRVVTHRIANLLQQGVASSNVLALTFTNKAAEEMRRRVGELVPRHRVWVSTFHRFCSKLLREHAALVGLAENFTIFDRSDSQKALQHALEGLPDLELGKIKASMLLKGISDCKQKLITARNYEARGGSRISVILGDVYPAYQNQLLLANAVDFDDLLLHTVELFRHNPALRHSLDDQYRYVMVDEYQDTNAAQYAIAHALTIDFPNLAVTGDPDQSIYGWRGADIRNILGFERDYPNAKVVRLEHNFRSSPEILSCADNLIRHNRQRRPKALLPMNESAAPVELCAFPSQQDEANYIAQRIKSEVDSGRRRYRDFAIFYRINALSRYLEHSLREYRIPLQVLNGVEFYQRKEVKDVVAYLQLINNPRNDVAYLRVINTPARGIGKKTLSQIADHARQHQCCMLDATRACLPELSKRASKACGEFLQMVEDLQRFATSPVEELLGHVLEKSGYADFVAGQDERADEDRSDNIRELLTAARQFDMSYPDTDYLDAFLEQASLVSDTDAWEDENDKVTLMTLHGSKGLEFPVVFIVAVEQGKLPHERSKDDPASMEEERRLLFVGITRAEEALSLTYAMYRDYRGERQGTVPSSFLMELPRDEMQVSVPNQGSAYSAFGDVHHDEFYQAEYEDESFAEYTSEEDLSNEGLEDDDLDDDALDFDTSQFDAEEATSSATEIPSGIAAMSVVTASSLENADDRADTKHAEPPPKKIDPDAFSHGMRVKHPEYGLGKIIALSGEGKNRTATVNFVLSGEKRFVLAFSMLQPA